MIVCHACQTENPDHNKFCQGCGASLIPAQQPDGLTGGVVLEADSSPPPEAASRGTISRLAILAATPAQENGSSETAAPLAVLKNRAYLDPDQRYQIVDALATAATKVGCEAEVRVVDLRPADPSPLEAWADRAVIEYSAEAEENHELSEVRDRIVDELPDLPESAAPYVLLQHHLYPSFPQIHDAWSESGCSIVLIEDRDSFPQLAEVLQQASAVNLQVLHWLHEITELWAVLTQQNCCRSLLEISNLRVDEDQILCLRRLYADAPDAPPPALKNLGCLWRRLFEPAHQPPHDRIAALYEAMEAEEILTLDEVRSHLELIADQIYQEVVAESASGSAPVAPAADENDAEWSEVTRNGGSAATNSQWNGFEISDDLEDFITEEEDTPTVVLPMQLYNLMDAGLTDIGRQRDHNEDCFSISTEVKKVETPTGRCCVAKGLYVLCDGMGGHAAGEVASAIAVETLQAYFQEHWQDELPTEKLIHRGIVLANQKIYDLNQENATSGSGRMGTTLVLMLVHDTNVAIAHVGDSRIYCYRRKQGLEQLTTDHEVGQREIHRGIDPELAYARPDAYQLTQALGPRGEDFIRPEIRFIEVTEDALFILGSDGLTDNDLLETYCETHVEPLLSSQAHLEQGVFDLVTLANQHNGHDNITAIAVRFKLRPRLRNLTGSLDGAKQQSIVETDLLSGDML
ncbi:MAG: serine/threonine phosphatase [Elainellaceae cyanobacterium]